MLLVGCDTPWWKQEKEYREQEKAIRARKEKQVQAEMKAIRLRDVYKRMTKETGEISAQGTSSATPS